MLLWTWVYRYLFKPLLLPLLDIYPEVELLNYMVILCLIFWGITILCSTGLYNFTFLPAVHTGSSFFHILTDTLFCFVLFCFNISIYICKNIGIYLTTNSLIFSVCWVVALVFLKRERGINKIFWLEKIWENWLIRYWFKCLPAKLVPEPLFCVSYHTPLTPRQYLHCTTFKEKGNS